MASGTQAVVDYAQWWKDTYGKKSSGQPKHGLFDQLEDAFQWLGASIKAPLGATAHDLRSLWFDFNREIQENKAPKEAASIANFKQWLLDPIKQKGTYGYSRIMPVAESHWQLFLKDAGFASTPWEVKR